MTVCWLSSIQGYLLTFYLQKQFYKNNILHSKSRILSYLHHLLRIIRTWSYLNHLVRKDALLLLFMFAVLCFFFGGGGRGVCKNPQKLSSTSLSAFFFFYIFRSFHVHFFYSYIILGFFYIMIWSLTYILHLTSLPYR